MSTLRSEAAKLFNRTWELMELPHRTPAEDAEMRESALQSLAAWEQVGDAINWARGEWQVSRVYRLLRNAPACLAHATRCREYCERETLSPFDHLYAFEALAWAELLCGNSAAADAHFRQAESYLAQLTDPEERDLAAADLQILGSAIR